ncbi:MAG: DinB family protein [Blastocatellia bacterium]|nr:DinB family protein [Blastocatellia bacterium]
MTAEACIDLPCLGGIHGEIEDWVAGLEASRTELESLISNLTPAALTWRPITDMQPIGTLILHIAYTEAFWLTEIDRESQKYLWDDTASSCIIAAPTKPLSWYVFQLRHTRTNSIKSLSQNHSLNEIYLRQKENGETEKYTLRWVLWNLLKHEAHHRGQIELLKKWYEQTHAPVYA